MAKEKKQQPSQPTSIAKVAGSGTQATTTCEETVLPLHLLSFPPKDCRSYQYAGLTCNAAP